MACGVTFWQMPDEETAFFEYLVRTDEICTFPFATFTDRSLICSTPLTSLLGRTDTTRLCLTLQEYASNPAVFEFEREGSPRYTLGPEFPCLIYTVGSIENGQLSQSNASSNTYFLDKSQNVIRNHPDPFVKWIRRVMGWLRRSTPEWHRYRGYRVTKAAAQEALSGLSLVPYHGWVGPDTGKSSFMPGHCP